MSSKLRLCCLFFGICGIYPLANGQMAEFKMSKEEKLMNVILPVVLIGNEFGLHLEFNLGGEASLGIDYIHVSQGQEISNEQIKEENSSMITSGQEVALSISRFSRSEIMAGFYYTLGAGYRFFDAEWKKSPDESYGLSSYSLDDEGRLTHDLQATGATARGRIGYRYAAESWPLLAGTFFGIRHYESKFEDRNSKNSTPTTVEEKEELRRRFMSKAEFGVELGFSF